MNDPSVANFSPTFHDTFQFIINRLSGKYCQSTQDLYFAATKLPINLDSLFDEAGIRSALVTSKMMAKYIDKIRKIYKPGFPITNLQLDACERQLVENDKRLRQQLEAVSCPDQTVDKDKDRELFLSNSVGSLPYLQAALKSSTGSFVPEEALLDTGCSTVIAKYSLFKQLGLSADDVSPGAVKIRTASGLLTSKAVCNMSIMLRAQDDKWYATTPTEVVFIDSQYIPNLICGRSWLIQNAFQWSAKREGKEELVLDVVNRNGCKVRRKCDIIYPGSSRVVSAEKQSLLNKCHLLQSDSPLASSVQWCVHPNQQRIELQQHAPLVNVDTDGWLEQVTYLYYTDTPVNQGTKVTTLP